jgi:hypothetical protein
MCGQIPQTTAMMLVSELCYVKIIVNGNRALQWQTSPAGKEIDTTVRRS